MLVKVCGMRDEANLKEVVALKPNYIGLIFYQKSPRYVSDEFSQSLCSSINGIKKVGVFVNETLENILDKTAKFGLDCVQLHGNETSELCSQIKDNGVEVFKAFNISDMTDFVQTENFVGVCDLFIFDTKTPSYGGSGIKFDWSVLDEYKFSTPFLLSGGIGEDDAKLVSQINHDKMIGVDLNSKFELSPAYKDVAKLKRFLNRIR